MIVNVKVVRHLAPELAPLLNQPLRTGLAQRVTLVKFFEYDLVEHNTVVYRLND